MEIEELRDRQERTETERYMRRLVQGGMLMLVLALILNVLAALYSHIALWQVLLWLCVTSIVVSFLSFAGHLWMGRNNL